MSTTEVSTLIHDQKEAKRHCSMRARFHLMPVPGDTSALPELTHHAVTG